LVLPDDSIRLIDFGVCKIQDDGELLTLVDEDVGVRNYTAPECEAGNDTQIGIQSDLYSAGKVLWSVITSQRVFAREEPAFTAKAMSHVFPAIPDTWHLTSIFEQTVRSNPSDRCRTAADLLQRINEVRYLIEHGYPPLEQLAERCPACGRKTLTDYHQGHRVFGNPKP